MIGHGRKGEVPSPTLFPSVCEYTRGRQWPRCLPSSLCSLRGFIVERTKAALAERRIQGVRLGWPQNPSDRSCPANRSREGSRRDLVGYREAVERGQRTHDPRRASLVSSHGPLRCAVHRFHCYEIVIDSVLVAVF